MKFAWIAVAALAGCALAPPAPSYRDADARIGSTTRYAPDLFEGDWMVRGTYPGDGTLHAISVGEAPTGGRAFEMVTRSCDSSGACDFQSEYWPAVAYGQGRYRLEDPSGTDDRDIWVLWVDEGFRTAALGTPGGTWAWVLDRQAAGGADRIKAAREILEFNGYDLGAMEMRQ